jgi:hypothetical protein
LLEGEGSISVDKPKNSNSLRIRIFISLLNTRSAKNLEMLNLIKSVIGGRVVIERKNNYVT